MKKETFKKTLALILALCMVLTNLFVLNVGVVTAQAAENSTTVYFLNTNGWAEVGAYVYGDAGEALGGWGTSSAATSTLGGDWMEVTVPAAAPFSIIFYNKAAESERAELYLPDADSVYVTVNATAYKSQADAEASMGIEEPAPEDGTVVYFLNTDGWAEVGAYAYNTTPAEALGGWGTTSAEAAPELGDAWMKVTVPAEAPFNIIFYNKAADSERAELQIPDADSVYVATDSKAYQSQAAAETAMGVVSGNWLYFLNTENWANVNAYIYGDKGEVLGGWPGAAAIAASELGENWVKVQVSQLPAYNVIFFNADADSQRAELLLPDAESIYVTTEAKAYQSQADAEASMGIEEPAPEDGTVVYFLNTNGWAEVGAYVYGNAGEALGGWGTSSAAASTLGGDWMEVTVPAAAPFSIIFYNKAAESERAELYLSDADSVYVTVNAMAYKSQAEAEESMGIEVDPTAVTTVYFLNSGKWSEVGAYAYNTIPAEALGGWGTTSAVAASEVGADWMKVDVPAEAPFNIIFYNKAAESERAELQIPNAENVYVAINANAYASAAAAENAMNSTPTTIYFLNWTGEKTVFTAPNAYVWSTEGAGEAAGGWPGLAMTAASELGENWWQVQIPANASNTPFNVIINGDNTQLADVHITNYTNNYITAAGGFFTSQSEAERSVGIVHETVVYYLNAEGWESIGAYVYGACGEALGSWPGKDAEAASELGENWVKVTVPAKAPFSIIFFDKADPDPERAELYLASDLQNYVAGCKTHSSAAAYGSELEAELAMGLGDPSLMATLYFYNSRGWGDINGYVFREENGTDITVGAGWPGTACEPAEDIGENWWKLLVPRTPTEEDPFYVVFNDGVNQTQEDILIDETVNVYITAACGTYPTPEEAEAAAANDIFDDGCEEGPNADIENYDVTFSGAGAALPYVTYEAETAETNAEVLQYDTVYRNSIQTEASGRQAVELTKAGDYVEFNLTEDANALVLRYAMPDSADGSGIDSTLSLYIDGEDAGDLNVTSKYAWVYGGYPFNNNPANGMAHRFFDETRLLLDETLPAGTTIRLQKDEADAAEYYVIDFIECEQAAAPAAQPEGSLSVTEFGAVADDGQDDRAAFEAAIAAAQEQGKEVWIPEGRFDLVEEEAIIASGVTIRGAGMWYTELYGAGAAFKYQGTSKFYDFAMTGVSTVRDDSGDLAGFESTGSRATNITIQNIWMEHMKVGVWSANTYRMAIQGCRIRNTYADGINLCSATHDSVVRNNSMRNTGDDAIASWPWLADCSGNTICYNTIQVPTLANGVAIYGGGNQTVTNNHVMDTINNGAGIVVGSEFDTAKGYTGTVTVKDNLLERCGSMQTDENYPIGAIWIWSSWSPMTTSYTITGNEMNDCVKEGILIEVNSELTGLEIKNNTVNGATNAVYEYLNGPGSGKVSGLTVSNLTGEEYVDNAPNFNLELVEEEEPTEPTEPTEPSEPTEETTEPTEETTEPTEETTEPTEETTEPTEETTEPTEETTEPTEETTEPTEETTEPTEETTEPTEETTEPTEETTEPTEETTEPTEEPECDGGENCPSKEFTDVNLEAWYHAALDYVLNNDLMNGYPNDKFGPDDELSRAMMVQTLYNLEGKITADADESYTDVDPEAWYAEAIGWAASENLVKGYGDGTFGPDDLITREQIVTILYRYSENKGYDLTEGSCDAFTDAADVSEYAQTAMNWAVGKGLIIGMDNGKLEPAGNTTRAQLAQILQRYIEMFAQ